MLQHVADNWEPIMLQWIHGREFKGESGLQIKTRITKQ